MLEIRETSANASWFAALRDRTAKAHIDIPIRRLSLGNFGDARPAGEDVTELLIHYGPGYRIYLKQQGDALVILLAGGDKSSIARDAGLGRESLYKFLSSSGNPELATVLKVISALGLQLHVSAIDEAKMAV